MKHRQHYHQANHLRDLHGADMPWYVSDAVICLVLVLAIALSVLAAI